MNRAIVSISDAGDVTAVQVDGHAVEFEIEKEVAEEWNPAHMTTFLPPSPSAETLAALAKATPPVCTAVVPWSRMAVRPHDQFATGCAYVLPSNALPETGSFFPLNASYASGLSMVEIEPLLDAKTGMCLSREFFLTSAATSALDKLQASLREPLAPADIPGFVHADTVEVLRPFSAPTFADDPVLNIVGLAPRRAALAVDDYVGFAYSDWADVSADAKALDGHRAGSAKYYAYVRKSLPYESCDQLRILRYINHRGLTWKQLATCPPFARAVEEAHRQRHALLLQCLAALGLQPRLSNPTRVDTDWNILDPTEVTALSADEGEEPNVGIVFFSGVSPSHLHQGGVLVENGDTRQEGLLWLHGPPSAVIGGDSFHLMESCNSLPTQACGGGRLNKKHITSAGWQKAWGHATLNPIVFV